ncbi:MAG TPA: glycosyltransferase family 2 protein [Bacteroidota bacterium]
MRQGTFPLSVIVIARNEERNIAECLKSVDWADDLVVVDAESSDRTAELARRFTGKVFVTPWRGFSEAKELALRHASNEWVLWLDADERVPAGLQAEIRESLKDGAPAFAGFTVARRAYFLGKWIRHCGWYPGLVLRLFRKEAGAFSRSRVHERLELRGPAGRLKHDLLHFTDETLYHYFSKFNSYTSLAAADAHEAGKSCSAYDLLVRPPYLFFKMYVLRRGFLDGMHGLVLSLCSASYVFVKYAKLKELAAGSPARAGSSPEKAG